MKTYWEQIENLLRTNWKLIENILKTYCEQIENLLRTYWKLIVNKLLTNWKLILLKTYWEQMENLVKTNWKLSENLLRTRYPFLIPARWLSIDSDVLLRNASPCLLGLGRPRAGEDTKEVLLSPLFRRHISSRNWAFSSCMNGGSIEKGVIWAAGWAPPAIGLRPNCSCMLAFNVNFGSCMLAFNQHSVVFARKRNSQCVC